MKDSLYRLGLSGITVFGGMTLVQILIFKNKKLKSYIIFTIIFSLILISSFLME